MHGATAEARRCWSLCSATREATTMRSLCTAARESQHKSNEDLRQPKIINKLIKTIISSIKWLQRDFPGGLVVKNLPCNAGDASSIPGWGKKSPFFSEKPSLCIAATKPVPQPVHPCITVKRIPRDPTRIPCAKAKT